MATPESPAPSGSGRRLPSWKEIAAYLEREVRTVRRWEKSEGLPVHRHVHNRQSTVYAYRAELDAWLAERRSTPGLAESSPRRPLLWVGALVICIVVVLASMLVVWHPPASG